MRASLIHNPGAGDEQPSADELIKMLRDAGHEATYHSSKEDGWERALDDPADIVAVAGGDGTVGKVARRLVGRGVPVAVLPLGTANNISKTFGLTDIPLARLVEGWTNARRVPLDVGVVNLAAESAYFVEGLGVGLFASLMYRLDSTDNIDLAHADDTEEKIASVLRMLRGRLRDYPVAELKVTLDGADLSGEYVLLEAMNINYVGPNLHLAPVADPCDGLLDVVLLRGDERDELAAYLDSRLAGTPRPPGLPVRRGRQLQIEWGGFDMHVDDEVWPKGDGVPPDAPAVFDVTINHRALELLLPAL